MKIKLKHLAAALTLSTSLLVAAPALAEDAQMPAAVAASPSVVSYTLNDQLQVQILGVLSEQNSSSAKLGAAVRIINTSGDTVRIPDHELRLKTDDGIVYSLPPSIGNAHGIAAQSEVDLTYLRQFDRNKDLKVTELSLVNVNYDVYPKQETTLVSAPVASQVWTGNHGVLSDSASLKKWGEKFTVPMLESPLTYTPVSISKSYTNQGATYLVRLLVDNSTDQTETVPIFEIDGKSKTEAYRGSRVETGSVTVEPGSKTYIHFAIQTDLDVDLDSLNVLALEPFSTADATGQVKSSSFGIGKLNINLPVSAGKTDSGKYEFGAPISFEANNDFINPDLNVSLVELHSSESVDNGYKTVLAKFKLVNKGEKPIPVPALQTELENAGSGSYNGVRQTSTVSAIQPGTGAIVSYAFVMPSSEVNTAFSLKLQGTVQSDSASPVYRSTIATLPVSLQGDEDRSSIHLYPFTLNFKSWTTAAIFQTVSNYNYRVRIDMDLTRDPSVVLDNSFSALKFELIDGSGRSIGSQSFPFVGTNRLVSGDQWLYFNGITTDEAKTNLTIRVSESVMTPNGEMSRVIAVLQ